MTNCDYPDCKATELNKWGMCKKHEPSYTNHPKVRFKGRSNKKYIKAGFERLAEEARKRDLPKLEPKPQTLFSKVAEELIIN